MSGTLDYADRPSKLVSRRILIDTLKRLRSIDRLSAYSYVGFGAYQFLDFDLIHRKLGVTKMTSIENDEKLIARCHFNAPYKGITVVEGDSNTILPTLDWSSKSIVWLDYTQRLRREEMSDCENVALRLQPGSVFAVTLNCHPGDQNRVPNLAEAVGSENVPIGTTEAKLGEWGLAKTQRELVTALLHRTFASRGDSATWHQLLNIYYRDDARMQMLAGIVDNPDTHDRIRRCRFEDMPEMSADAEPLVIEIPTLTIRERQALSKKLPARTIREFAGIKARDLESYAKFYKWLDAVC